MNKCDHTVAFIYDYDDSNLYKESDYRTPNFFGQMPCEDEGAIEFNYCPFCGWKLEEKTC